MTMRVLLGMLVVIAVVGLCAGCGGSGATPPTESHSPAVPSTQTGEAEAAPQSTTPGWDDARELSSGRLVYVDNCMRCHGDKGLGDGPDAASLYKRPANLQEHVGHHSEAALTKIIRGGREPMPAFKDLSADDLEALLAYLPALVPGDDHSGHGH